MSLDIKSIFHPDELKGYIFVEGDTAAIDKVIQGVPHVKGIIRKEVSIFEKTKHDAYAIHQRYSSFLYV